MNRNRYASVLIALALTFLLTLPARADEDATKQADVTKKVVGQLKDNKISFTVNSDLLGDPSSGDTKKLRIVYTLDGKSQTRTFLENFPAEITPAAGQKLVVVSAVYGVLDGAVDVTAKVRSTVAENALTITANNDTFGDPDVGVTKQLRVTYTIDGVTKTDAAAEDETLTITKPEGDKKLVIVEASYGAPVLFFDVTDKVSKAVTKDTLSITADNDTFGDPATGVTKRLKIDYTVAGKDHTITVDENETAQLPATGDGTGALVIKKAVYGQFED